MADRGLTRKVKLDLYDRNEMMHPEKCNIRDNHWFFECKRLRLERGRGLNMAWCARPDFTDLPPKGTINEVHVVECVDKEYTKKRGFLKSRPWLTDTIKLAKKQRMLKFMQNTGVLLDLANFDFCNHLSDEILETIRVGLSRNVLVDDSVLFLTVANRSPARNKNYPQHIRIVDNKTEALAKVNEVIPSCGWSSEVTLNTEYYSSARSLMYSFGFRLHNSRMAESEDASA